MIFKPCYYVETGCVTHLFGCGGLGTCAVVLERQWNPLLSRSRDEFVAARSEVPPRPAAMEEILRGNQGRQLWESA